MVALTTLIIFFAVLLIVYLSATMLVSLWAWLRKRREARTENDQAVYVRIDETADKLKNQLFIISMVVAFFVIAPFLAFLMILN